MPQTAILITDEALELPVPGTNRHRYGGFRPPQGSIIRIHKASTRAPVKKGAGLVRIIEKNRA